MSVLITGGTGYIGSHIALTLLKQGQEVVLVDNFSNSSPKALNRIKQIIGVEKMRELETQGESRELALKKGHEMAKNLKFYNCDVRHRKDMEAVFAQNNIEVVIHLAGFKSVAESVRNPLKYYQNNIGAATNLLEVMNSAGCKNLIFSSSATVYGDNAIPYREDMEVRPCSSPYGTTKAMIEQICMDQAAADPDFAVIILRYFNPIGNHPSGRIGEDPKGIPNNLMPIILDVANCRRESLTVFGDDYPTEDGTCKRDYIHVMDLAAGHCRALDYLYTLKNGDKNGDGSIHKNTKKTKGKDGNHANSHSNVEIFNLGTGRSYSVLEIINTFQEVTGKSVTYTIGSRRPGDVPEMVADVSKANNILGWQAERDLDAMCRDADNWGGIRGKF